MSRKTPNSKTNITRRDAAPPPVRKSVAMPPGSSLVEADTPPMGATRWCTYCLGPRDSTGGMWMILIGGATRRWLCLNCAAKHRPFSASVASKAST